jgi:anti-sigma factor RsiW
MTNQQLEALLIDQSLGELPEEISALLDAYLAQSPELNPTAARLRDAVTITEQVVVGRPELLEAGAGTPEPVARAIPDWVRWRAPSPLIKRAALFGVLGMAMGLGFFAGKLDGRSPEKVAPRVAEQPDESEAGNASPWARYRFEEDGRLAVVPVFEPQS